MGRSLFAAVQSLRYWFGFAERRGQRPSSSSTSATVLTELQAEWDDGTVAASLLFCRTVFVAEGQKSLRHSAQTARRECVKKVVRATSKAVAAACRL